MEAIKHVTKIAVVDHHPIVRHGIRRLMEMQTDMVVCAELDGSEDVSALVRQLQPDVLILDIWLAKSDGIAITRQLRNQAQNLPVIIFSMHESAVYISRAIRAGANGYVIKNQAPHILIEAIREVRQGRKFICAKNAKEISSTVSAYHPSEDCAPLELLSDREMQIFSLIGRGFSTIEIADLISIKPKTVETYRSRIKEKLEVDSFQRLYMTAIGWATREGIAAPVTS